MYRVGVWLSFVRFALPLAVVLCWADRCFGYWVLLGLLCLLRVSLEMEAGRVLSFSQVLQPSAAGPVANVSVSSTWT